MNTHFREVDFRAWAHPSLCTLRAASPSPSKNIPHRLGDVLSRVWNGFPEANRRILDRRLLVNGLDRAVDEPWGMDNFYEAAQKIFSPLTRGRSGGVATRKEVG